MAETDNSVSRSFFAFKQAGDGPAIQPLLDALFCFVPAELTSARDELGGIVYFITARGAELMIFQLEDGTWRITDDDIEVCHADTIALVVAEAVLILKAGREPNEEG